ncbi:MAG: GGDEF domain-containing protein [Bradyrhizobiaceae bacterium]|nr:GGDEF domain-containing protein [Bradyrhizobiaceae bacterium]
MTGKSSPAPKKRGAARAAPSRAGARQREKPEAAKSAPKARSVSMRLAAKIDALKAELAATRTRIADLQSKIDEDPLTGLLNRRGFERALERALAYVRRYRSSAALLYLDLDHFKPINDRHGHAVGDWVLGRVARLIAGHVRASDVVARVGGDELAALLWNVSAAQAAEKARALEAMIDGETFEHAGKRLTLGLSAGAIMLSAEYTVDGALARADEAMYARKRERKGIAPSS